MVESLESRRDHIGSLVWRQIWPIWTRSKTRKQGNARKRSETLGNARKHSETKITKTRKHSETLGNTRKRSETKITKTRRKRLETDQKLQKPAALFHWSCWSTGPL